MEQDDLGGTPLHDAAEHGQMEVWKYHYSFMFCYIYPKAVKLLVAMGADPHIRDSDQLTPADLAEDGGFHECAEYLKKQSPKPIIEVEVTAMLKLERILIMIMIMIMIITITIIIKITITIIIIIITITITIIIIIIIIIIIGYKSCCFFRLTCHQHKNHFQHL